jgi:hypothetical protein
MHVFIYQSALYCERCGNQICSELRTPAGADLNNESTWDSEDYPKGPYDNGGGEADSPQHCDGCLAFLENPLTSEGVEYVDSLLAASYDEADDSKWQTGSYSDHVSACLAADGFAHESEWASFYEMPDAPTNEAHQ